MIIMMHDSTFFFQAEDGIRDSSVTGVQTCALPISQGCRLASLSVLGLLAVPALAKFHPQRRFHPRSGSPHARSHFVAHERCLASRIPETLLEISCRSC